MTKTKAPGVRVEVPTADAMEALGQALGRLLTAGDLVVLTGELGAGKTCLTRGLAAGLGVAGPVISPTFVLSRIHRSTVGGPDLVHADAYRLSSAAEIDDLDLDLTAGTSVTVVEWGNGLTEHLAADRLDIGIERSDDPEDDTRVVTVEPVGERWDGVDLTLLGAEGAGR